MNCCCCWLCTLYPPLVTQVYSPWCLGLINTIHAVFFCSDRDSWQCRKEQRRGAAGPGGFEHRRLSWLGPRVTREGGDTCCSQLPIRAFSHHRLYPTVSTRPLTHTIHTHLTNSINYKYEAQIWLRALTCIRQNTPKFVQARRSIQGYN